MSWKTHLEPASFRGATFNVSLVDTGMGRRVELKTFKNKDYVNVRDLGGDADEFIVEGYIVQNLNNNFDYFNDRDKLIKALKTKGPGTLVHPYYGKMEVALLEKARVVETFEEGGIARFTMTFVQYKKPIFQQGKKNFIDAVDTSALAVINAALDDFAEFMDTAGAFINTLTAPITSLITNLQQSVTSINGAIAATISTTIGLLNTGVNLVSTLLDSPCSLANTIIDAVQSFRNLVGLSGDVVSGGIVGGCSGIRRGEEITLDGTEVPEELGSSTTDKLITNSDIDSTETGIDLPDEQTDNNILVSNLFSASLIAEASKISIRINYSSQEKMLAELEKITDSIDSFLLRLGAQEETIDNTRTYNAIDELKNTIVSSMLNKNAGLVKEIDYTVPSGVQSTLELAYDKYYDLDRCADIFLRNRNIIRHPGFPPSNEVINILNE